MLCDTNDSVEEAAWFSPRDLHFIFSSPMMSAKRWVREARAEHVFRYAHVFPRCVAVMSSGAIDVKPLITRTLEFEDSVQDEIAASAA
ncbi:hypothetical protein NKH24_34765 [Mesorhizobium sp. M1300]|uniref:hypothetical protein n=1 Tax=Mesorhizobium sp. M1300 TaxID=2957077 RepID=UPI003334DDFB